MWDRSKDQLFRLVSTSNCHIKKLNHSPKNFLELKMPLNINSKKYYATWPILNYNLTLFIKSVSTRSYRFFFFFITFKSRYSLQFDKNIITIIHVGYYSGHYRTD